VTQTALEELRSQKAIDQVTIILGYSNCPRAILRGYDAKLMAGIERLAQPAKSSV
jgi:hypothetical protein